jgi:RNA polymerase primary sigma factor
MKNFEDGIKSIYKKESEKLNKDFNNDQILSLVKLAQEGDTKARDEIFYNYTRFVFSIVRRYRRVDYVDFLDLVQEGNLGLLKAIEKFDTTRKIHFSSYSFYWIRMYIRDYIINQPKVIRIPEYLQDIQNKLEKTREKLFQKLQREPTEEELSEYIPIDKIKRIMIATRTSNSFNSNVAKGEKFKLEEIVKDKKHKLPEEVLEEKQLRKKIYLFLDTLDKREKRVIVMRFGLINGHKRKLREVAKVLNVTTEWARMIEKKALEKLSSPYKRKQLLDYI